MKFNRPQRLTTYVTIDDEEHIAEVCFDSSPPEPDVGWAGGLDIESVYIRDTSEVSRVRDRLLDEKISFTVDVTNQVSDQFGRIQAEIEEHMAGWMEDDRY